MRSATIMS